MAAADEFQQINPRLAFWQAYEPAVKCELSSCAFLTRRGLVLVDPIRLAKPAMAELLDAAPAAAIVLTNGNHARAAEYYRQQLSIPVYASSAAELEIAVDHELHDGELVLDELTAVSVAGAGPGEIALFCPANPASPGAMLMGDALINLEPEGLRLLPDKYCADPKALPGSLRKLLAFEFELMTFAHGLPLGADARRKLQTLFL